jgi:gluconolactonase
MSHSPSTRADLVCDGLQFPEGPVPLDDGSVLVVEIRRATLTRVSPDGRTDIVADWGDPAISGPNGAAIGPDGSVFVCNNGGFNWHEIDGVWHPKDPVIGATHSPSYVGGSIDTVDLTTGTITTLYTHCGGARLRSPNDLVFDSHGGFYFTDMGKNRAGAHDHGALFYARSDGSEVDVLVEDLVQANGVGLSPDGSTVYVAETRTGRLWAFDLEGPGRLATGGTFRFIDGHHGRNMANTLGYFDSLAVTVDGSVVVAALQDGLCVVPSDGSGHRYVAVDDPLTTNIAFGGSDRRTAYVTGSGTGRLLALEWPVAGLEPAF